MPISTISSAGVGLNALSASNLDTTTQYTGFKNRIINGAMVIDQRNAGASVSTSSGTSTYAVDRCKVWYTQTSKFTVQQNAGSVTPPSGFINYVGVTSSSAFSVGSTDRFMIGQGIEGLNVVDLGWGAAGASTVTISFWVRSSLTGTFGGALGNLAGDRSYAFTYTISSANTWEYKTVTIAGDTTGSWPKDTSGGLYLYLTLGAGSSVSTTASSWQAGFYVSATGATSVVGTSGATFYITGVQLEKGSTATSFDYRPYGTELDLCYRYYFQKTASDSSTIFGIPNAYNGNLGNQWFIFWLPIVMRAIPTVTSSSWVSGSPSATYPGTRAISFNFTDSTYYMGNATAVTVSAEL